MQPATEWTTIVRDLGFPIAIVMVLGLFLYKMVWPFITQEVLNAQAAREASERKCAEAAAGQAKEFSLTIERQAAQFIAALSRRDEVARRQEEHFAAMVAGLKEIREIVVRQQGRL